MKTKLLIAFALIMASALPNLTDSGTAGVLTTTLPVSINVVSGCTVSATGISFGTITAGSASNYSLNASNGSIAVTCASGLPYTVTLDDGDHYNITFGRSMGGPNIVPYELYKDAALTQVWGDSGFAGLYTEGTPATGTGTGSSTTLTVYGKLKAGGNPTVGPQTDNIIVTLIF